MITIISPATTMNFDKDSNLENSSNPVFKEDVNYLISILKELNIKEISNLMNLSEDLSKLNYDRYQNLLDSNNKKLQSILAFDGEVFNSMNTSDFNEYDFNFANDHLRILSGLYGILSPLDLIEPYRLEMKAKLENKNGKDLYKFWKNKITDYIIKELETHESKVLLNLASSEYLKCIDLKPIKKDFKFIDVVFKDYDLNAVVLDSTIDNNFISFIEYKEMGIKFKRIDSDLSDVLKDKDNEENKEDDEKIISLFKDIIGDRVEKYLVESLKNEETPAMILISEESRRMMEMQSRFAGMDFGMNLKEEKTLVINNNNLLVKKLVSLKDNEDKKEEINVICNQIVDLALLANKELNAEELDLFIKRSNSLMSKVISL